MERVWGTTFGHAYASIECVHTTARFTLAALPLHQFTTKEQIITDLVTEARTHIDISFLFLDREFFNVASLDTLRDLLVWFVIPADHNTQVKKHIIQAHHHGINFLGTTSFALITLYTIKKGKKQVIVTIVIVLYPSQKPWKSMDGVCLCYQYTCHSGKCVGLCRKPPTS